MRTIRWCALVALLAGCVDADPVALETVCAEPAVVQGIAPYAATVTVCYQVAR